MERTYKAPAREYTHKVVFNRFKYAEEAAKKITQEGHPWVMFRDDDKIEIEYYSDGTSETYTVEQYVVLWDE